MHTKLPRIASKDDRFVNTSEKNSLKNPGY